MFGISFSLTQLYPENSMHEMKMLQSLLLLDHDVCW